MRKPPKASLKKSTKKASPHSPLVQAMSGALQDLDEMRADVWEEALRAAEGNSALAARDLLTANRRRGHYLTKRYGLQELARELKDAKKSGKKGTR